MNKHRIAAIVWRHWYNFKHSLDRMVDAFYWPAMDILLWGITSVYISESGSDVSQIVLLILSGLVLWQVTMRSQYEITINLLEEAWNTNLMNLFASPLTIWEWIVGISILAFIKMVITVVFAGVLVWWLYQLNILNALSWWLLPFMGLLLIFGWALGFLVSGLIFRFGTRIQALAWTIVWIIAPFSAVFYPLQTLPAWAQRVAAFLPTSYIFEGMRAVLLGNRFDLTSLTVSAILTVVYLAAGIVFFLACFNHAKKGGLARVEQ